MGSDNIPWEVLPDAEREGARTKVAIRYGRDSAGANVRPL